RTTGKPLSYPVSVVKRVMFLSARVGGNAVNRNRGVWWGGNTPHAKHQSCRRFDIAGVGALVAGWGPQRKDSEGMNTLQYVSETNNF
ncbi:MAG: hypothetical protein AAFP90_16480, partial [Planctomycetota bacterium]